MNSGLDWPGMMRAGLHLLRLQPHDFWAQTPAELAMMLGQTKGMARMDRTALAALEAAYPDKERTQDE